MEADIFGEYSRRYNKSFINHADKNMTFVSNLQQSENKMTDEDWLKIDIAMSKIDEMYKKEAQERCKAVLIANNYK
jgi:hypothetical protein